MDYIVATIFTTQSNLSWETAQLLGAQVWEIAQKTERTESEKLLIKWFMGLIAKAEAEDADNELKNLFDQADAIDA